MSKPKEWFIEQGCHDNQDLAVGTPHDSSVLTSEQAQAGEFDIDGFVHVIEKSAYDELERALAEGGKAWKQTIESLRADAERLAEALEDIKKTRYGLDSMTTLEERVDYWSDMALFYRRQASAALAEFRLKWPKEGT